MVETTPADAVDQGGVEESHPSWCDRARCSADFPALAAGKWSGVPGAGWHCSAPVSLGVLPFPLPDGLQAYLTQSLAPWNTATLLKFGSLDGELWSQPAWDLDSASQMLVALAELVKVAQAAQHEEAQRWLAGLKARRA
jgi:hypothetical protein